MEAKETVMTRLWLGENSTFISETTKLLEQQAKISFPLGEEQGRKAGIKEVVGWAIAERKVLKLIGEKEKGEKPADGQGQMVIRAKMRTLQQLINKFRKSGG